MLAAQAPLLPLLAALTQAVKLLIPVAIVLFVLVALALHTPTASIGASLASWSVQTRRRLADGYAALRAGTGTYASRR